MDASTSVTAEEIAQHTKGNDDKEVIITKELKSHLNELLLKEDKRKRKWTFGLRILFWILEQPGLLKWKKRDPASERERLGAWKKKLSNPLRLRESLTSTSVPREENQWIARTATY